MIQIVLALLLLTSFVACFFASKYWHWAQVLLVEVIFLAGLSYFLIAGEVFRIQNIYGEASQKNLAKIEQLEPQVEALKEGTTSSRVISQLEAAEVKVAMEPADEEAGEPARMMGLREIDHKLGMVTRTRGRVWRDAQFIGGDQATLTVNLGIEFPDPHGIEKDAIIYAFEQGTAAPAGEQGPQYLGEFRVVDVGPQQISVQPAVEFDERAVARLQNANQRPWIIYENMPADQHPNGRLEVFAGATPEQLRQLLPPESVEEYIRHGTEWKPDDGEWVKAGFDPQGNLVSEDKWDNDTEYRYRRRLRDYNLIFQELTKRYNQMQADHNALTADNQQLQETLASAKKLQAAREAEQAQLRFDLEGATRDRKAIEAHLAQVELQLANAQALLEETKKQNAGLAEMLTGQAL